MFSNLGLEDSLLDFLADPALPCESPRVGPTDPDSQWQDHYVPPPPQVQPPPPQIHPPQLHPPQYTIAIYSTAQSVALDQPTIVRALDQEKMASYVRTHSARRTSENVAATIRREFRVEDRFRARLAAGNPQGPKNKRRRNPATGSVWKPESVYKTFVECKPLFFDRTNYQDKIPGSSCFGKINMRCSKAWSRGPNRKRRAGMPLVVRDLGDPFVDSSFGSRPHTFDSSFGSTLGSTLGSTSDTLGSRHLFDPRPNITFANPPSDISLVPLDPLLAPNSSPCAPVLPQPHPLFGVPSHDLDWPHGFW